MNTSPLPPSTTYYPDGSIKEETSDLCETPGTVHKYYDQNERLAGYDTFDTFGHRVEGKIFGSDGSEYRIAMREDGSERMSLRDVDHAVSVYDLSAEGLPTLRGSYSEPKGDPAKHRVPSLPGIPDDGPWKEVVSDRCHGFGTLRKYFDESGRCTGFKTFDGNGREKSAQLFGTDGSLFSVFPRDDGSALVKLRSRDHVISVFDVNVDGVPVFRGSYGKPHG